MVQQYQALSFYDCNCQIGVRQQRHALSPATLDELLAEFDYVDIQAALVHHAAAREYSPDYGNRLLLREIGDDPRLLPQWVLLPHHTGEMAPPGELVAEMLARGVRAARIYPRSHGTGLSPMIWGELMEELQAHRLPLFIDKEELDFAAAETFLREYPELPVVICNMGWSFDRVLFPLMAALPNLHIDSWSYQNHRGYEVMVSKLGSERLLFSTNLPHRSPGAARMMTVYENLSDRERRNIAGGNLLRLLRGVEGAGGRPVPEYTPPREHPEDDPIVAAVRVGKPLSHEFVLDSHNHLGHPGSHGIDLCSIYYNDGDGLVGTMDRLGVDLACASSWAGITYAGPDANDHTLQAVSDHPGRLLAYGCLNPSYPELFAAEFERCFASGKVIGYKPAPFRQGVPLSDPVHFPVYEWARARRAPVLCGDGPLRLAEIDQVAASYPQVPFINAHSGSNYAFAESTVEVCRRHPNVYAEITYTLIWYGIIEYLVGELGAHRVLFGTDCVMRDAAPQLGWVAWARIPYADKQKVLGYNMADILQLPASQRQPRAPVI
jgi:predicted TIM-barrel fold metal-dependent hydrolase